MVFGNEKGNIDDIKSMDFAGILLCEFGINKFYLAWIG